MSLPVDVPAAYAGRPLFDAVEGLLARFSAPGVPSAAALSALYAEVTAGAGVRPIHFAAPPVDIPGYEEYIFTHDAVPTRPDDWHDFFNALAWCVWPASKAACNALHLRELRARAAAGLPGRGPVRDALTQFDECGVLVVSADAEIPQLLAAHEWEEVFWRRRDRLLDTTRFLVFGHATWDQLRQPFAGLCAKVLYRVVEAEWLHLPPSRRQAEADAWLAVHLIEISATLAPRRLAALPLLGIPGLTRDNERVDYYRDARQFRPLRRV